MRISLKRLALLLILLSLLWVPVRYAKSLPFHFYLDKRIDSALQSTDSELAAEELTRAIEFLESRGLTEGNTSTISMYFGGAPRNDVGLYYQRLVHARAVLWNSVYTFEYWESRAELEELLASPYTPSGISVYQPGSRVHYLWCGWAWLSLVLFIAGCVVLILIHDEKKTQLIIDFKARKIVLE